MRKLFYGGLLVAAVFGPTTSFAEGTPTIYATLAECQAALNQARDDNPIYWAAECRPYSSAAGTGWVYSIKLDKPDNKGPGN